MDNTIPKKPTIVLLIIAWVFMIFGLMGTIGGFLNLLASTVFGFSFDWFTCIFVVISFLIFLIGKNLRVLSKKSLQLLFLLLIILAITSLVFSLNYYGDGMGTPELFIGNLLAYLTVPSIVTFYCWKKRDLFI